MPGHELKPFIFSIIIFLCSYAGIAISVYPLLNSPSSHFLGSCCAKFNLSFHFSWGGYHAACFVSYTLYAYYVFRGKTGEGYH